MVSLVCGLVVSNHNYQNHRLSLWYKTAGPQKPYPVSFDIPFKITEDKLLFKITLLFKHTYYIIHYSPTERCP